jgi:hypothetical protein
LQTLALIANILKSGTINISANEENLFQLTVNNNVIDVNMLDKKFFKEVAKDAEKLSFIRHLLISLRSLAGELRNQETTIRISFKGEKVITVGSDAKPRFSSVVTRTTDIEINSLKRLIKIGAV